MPNDQGIGFSQRYGPYALVTGASEGIGESFAEALAKAGLNVILVARRHERLNALALRLESQYQVMCPVIPVDLSSPEQLQALLEVTQPLNVSLVVCNAGFGTAGEFLTADIETEINMLHVNCAALTRLVHHFGLKFAQQGAGGIILLSSVVATQGVARSAHYAATKAYVQTLGEGLQEEWKGRGLDVLIVAPGPVQTGFARRSQMRLGRTTSPEVVAREALKALGRQRLVHPGWLAKCMAAALSCAPRALRVKIMSTIMGTMTHHLPH